MTTLPLRTIDDAPEAKELRVYGNPQFEPYRWDGVSAAAAEGALRLGAGFGRRWREAAFIPVITPSLVRLKAPLTAQRQSAP